MTALPRFDPFERRITEAVDEIAAARRPDYLDDILRQTARTSQRARWTFPERWLPVDTALPRSAFGGRVPFRSLAILLVIIAMVAASIALYVGSQRHLPAPFGPAANGALAFSSNQDLYVRDALTGTSRLLIGGEGDQFAPSYSPDGQYLTYVTNPGGGDEFTLAHADGSNPILLAKIPATGNAQSAWAPDSRHVGLIYDVKGQPTLSMVTADGDSIAIDTGNLVPLDLAFSPPAGERLLVRARVSGTMTVGLYTMNLDGSALQTVVEPVETSYGTTFTLGGARWSPDGRTIAYNGIEPMPAGVTSPVSEHFRLHLVNPDGSNDRAVPGPSDPLVQENWPLYSPDGNWIAVARWTFASDGTPGATGWVAIMPANGSEAARDVGERFSDDADTGIAKIWSPDGTRLLELVASKELVYSIDPVTGQSELLPWTTALPDWQRIAE
jgi:Tol biopolymer transport system component